MNLGHYIDNKWTEGYGEEFISSNPASGMLNWSGREATDQEVQAAIESAASAFPTWSSLSFEKRWSYLKSFEESLIKQKEIVAEAISLETGKPWWESLSEVDSMIHKISITRQAYLERCVERKTTLEEGTLLTYHRPHGIVAILGPFNFPGHLPNGHIVPALLAGNTVVFKSSEFTPLVAEKMIQCWHAAGLPRGVINLLQGGPSTGRHLVSNPLLNGIFFTGNPKTGLLLLEQFALQPEKILALEMGGNNPLVVSDVSDLEAAAYLTIQSAYLSSGQRCSCARRLIVIEGKEGEEFLKALTHMVQTIRIGSYKDRPEPFMGPVIHTQSMESLLSTQAVLGSQGGIPLVEMRPLKEGTSFLSPGLMDVTALSHRVDEEYFGPFLQMIRVPTFEAAIQEANKTQYGLTAALFSKSEEKYRQFLHEVKAGVINWNFQTTGASSLAPFGGVKKSGNFRPSAYYASDYCVYPTSSIQSHQVHLPKKKTPGIQLL